MEGSLVVVVHRQGADTLACTEWASHGPPCPYRRRGGYPISL